MKRVRALSRVRAEHAIAKPLGRGSLSACLRPRRVQKGRLDDVSCVKCQTLELIVVGVLRQRKLAGLGGDVVADPRHLYLPEGG